MRLSLNWLKQYMDHGLSADELAQRMTMAGLEVEARQACGNDTVFEIEVTPNRPDCLNILGLAREVSAITDNDLRLPLVGHRRVDGGVDITIEDKDDCNRYIGTLIDGISVRPLPQEKTALLQAMGGNAINNIVDITNFVLFEFGQPLHAFDADKLEGGKIIVRRARKNEKIITLDHVERTLDETILVIADAKKPVAIAGIMGGRDTGVTMSTQRVLLESAHFDMGLIRRAARRLGLASDASYRFERGIDFSTIEKASDRAVDLILELAGGNMAGRKDVCWKEKAAAAQAIVVTSADIQKLLGTSIDLTRARRILERLGCAAALSGDRLSVVPPENRQDLRIKEDMIEEVARVIGFDNLPMTLPSVGAVNIPVDFHKDSFDRRVAGHLIGQGFHEALTYALISRAALTKAGYAGVAPIALQNPMSAEQELMRPTMLASLLQVVGLNMNHGQKDLKLFERGKIYLPAGERRTLALVVTGRQDADWRKGKRPGQDLFDLKGSLEVALCAERVKGLGFSAAQHGSFEPGQTADILLGGKPVGVMGKVSDLVLANFDIKKAQVYFAQIDLEAAVEAAAPQARFAELDEFPSVVRDVSLAVKDVLYEDLRALCLANGQGLLRKVELVEEYRGDKIEKESRGLVLSLTYQAKDKTLTEDVISALHGSIVEKLVQTFAVKIR